VVSLLPKVIFAAELQEHSMHWKIASGIAIFAVGLAWLAPSQLFVQACALLALAFIFSLGGVIEAINRCADEMQKKD
jgi:hypothetical protein